MRAGQEVKPHPAILHGEIVELEPELGYGFLRADDGQEVYFQKDGLVTGAWADLAVGARLRFREQDGEKGPFAVDVAPAAA
ncbi:cold-shock protein [Cypionkella sp.]|uniref:cold-shock protein n=1 Tax=Cypionkella sp. TaxID=2811411 RepID=UPI00271FD40F|nr:cold shock domain-containing protein [Cypionkella sp.]MDO8986207.1 cold shock domain-containing protein [Cypionkella sp.]